jgi:hypothetical protein
MTELPREGRDEWEGAGTPRKRVPDKALRPEPISVTTQPT